MQQPVSEQDLNTIVNQLQTQLQTPKPKQNEGFLNSKPVKTALNWWIAIGGIGTLVLWLFIGYVQLSPRPSQLHKEVKL